jgi:Sulfotransferase family
MRPPNTLARRMSEPQLDFPNPIFVGGVGRSGTHVMARLIGAGPRYHRVRTEARFHAWEGGLPDLCAGRTTLDHFLERMRGHWWQRGANQRQGLSRICDREVFDEALARFEQRFIDEPKAASRELIETLLGEETKARGKISWVEATGGTVEYAPFLRGLFPQAKFVNMVRDGRAVVAATLKKVNLTDEPSRALDRWEGMVRAAESSRRELGDERVLSVFLEDLAAHDRDGTFARLAAFLELDDPAPMREYFDREISAERAHVGAWRQRMAPADARWVDRRYRRLVRRLRRKGLTWVPEPDARTS